MDTEKVVLELTDEQITDLKHALRVADRMASSGSSAHHQPISRQVEQQFPRNFTCQCDLCSSGSCVTPYKWLEEENKKIRHALCGAIALNIAAVLAGIALILL